MIGVGALKSSELGRKRASEWGLNFDNIADRGEVWQKFGVINQPAFAVVTAQGEVSTHMGSLSLDGIISLVEQARLVKTT